MLFVLRRCRLTPCHAWVQACAFVLVLLGGILPRAATTWRTAEVASSSFLLLVVLDRLALVFLTTFLLPSAAFPT